MQYDLPPDRIAQHPCKPRDAARLMVLDRATGEIEHRAFGDLPEYLAPRDCLVLNRTRVLPARFTARRPTGGRIAGLFLKEHAPGRWTVLLNGAARLKPAEVLALPGPPPRTMTLLERGERGVCEVAIEPPDSAPTVLETLGAAPLPPYIRRPDDTPSELASRDRGDYQTVYADRPGAIAAPTAGMHFTPELLQRIRSDVGADIAHVTLHVGLGTFLPVEVEDLADHPMHAEWYDLPPEAAETIGRARAAGGRIIAVGTTAVRVLETCGAASAAPASPGQPWRLCPRSGWTDLLIYPPYTFCATDALLTNFHLPGSTLLALVCAFAGRQKTFRAYESAIERGYRFYSYGDAMLIR